ncbi:MAG: hypothetical protein WBE17_14210 [Anaerolineae bacterium]
MTAGISFGVTERRVTGEQAHCVIGAGSTGGVTQRSGCQLGIGGRLSEDGGRRCAIEPYRQQNEKRSQQQRSQHLPTI